MAVFKRNRLFARLNMKQPRALHCFKNFKEPTATANLPVICYP